MNPQTHYTSGRHVHNVVFDWRTLKSELTGHTFLFQQNNVKLEESDYNTVHTEKQIVEAESVTHGLQTKQLDYLYWQLDSLKQNMMEKQSCLANVSKEIL